MELKDWIKKQKYDVCPVCAMLLGKGCKHCMSTPEFVIPVEDFGEWAWNKCIDLLKESNRNWVMAWNHEGQDKEDDDFRTGRYGDSSNLSIESKPALFKNS